MSTDGLFQTIFKKLTDEICLNNLEDTFSKEFALLDNNFARIEYVVSHPQLFKILCATAKRTQKDGDKCMAAKDRGNKQFQRRNHAAAISAYNEAIVLAPTAEDNNGLLSMCYANRSAALFHMNMYRDCLKDIDRAIKAGYPSSMCYKLLARKAKCHQYVELDVMERAISDAIESLKLSELDDRKKQSWQNELSGLRFAALPIESSNDSLSHLERSNPSYPALSAEVSVSENNEFGRYIQSQADLQAGDCVLVEKPYCSVTLPDYYLTHCCHCQKFVDDTPVPCLSCADVVYCSENCQTTSWNSYHKYECHQMHNMKILNVNMGHLALRTAIQAGSKALEKLLENEETSNDLISGYLGVFTLEGHEKDRTPKDLFWRTVAAVLMSQLCDLDQWASGSVHDLTVLATFVLHNMQVLPCNAHEISYLQYDTETPYLSELLEVGAGIYPTLSFFNHSCDPTVVRTFDQGNTCVVKTLSPITKYDQLFDNYGCLYAVHDVQSRQKKLMEQYHFHCCCVACMQNWLLYRDMSYDSEPMFKCQQCNELVIDAVCDRCGANFDKEATQKVLTQAHSVFNKHLSDLFSAECTRNDIHSSLEKLTSYSNLVNRLVFRPYKSLNDCQEALKHVLNLTGNHVIKNDTQKCNKI